MQNLILIITIYLIMGAGPLFAYSTDNIDRISSENVSTFSPGYLNAAKYQAEAILRQSVPERRQEGLIGKTVGAIFNMLGFQIKKQGEENADLSPVLQKKSSSSGKGNNKTLNFDISSKDLGNGNYEVTLTQGGQSITKQITYEDYQKTLTQLNQQRSGEAYGKLELARALFYNELTSGWEWVSSGTDAFIQVGNGWQKAADYFNSIGYDIFYSNNDETYTIGHSDTGELWTASSTWDGESTYIRDKAGHFVLELSTIGPIGHMSELEYGSWRKSVGYESYNDYSTSNGFWFDNYGVGGSTYVYYNDVADGSGFRNNLMDYTFGIFGREAYQKAANSYIGWVDSNSVHHIDKLSDYIGTYIRDASNYTDNYYTQKTNEWAQTYVSTLSQQAAAKNALSNYASRDEDSYNGLLDNNLLDNTELSGDKGKGLTLASSKVAVPNAANIPPAEIERIVKDPLSESALAIPIKPANPEDATVAMKFSDIVKNPTAGQKMILDILKTILKDTEKLAEEAAARGNTELKKARDDLLQAVANILLTQAIPDLIKKGDTAGIIMIFSELVIAKDKIMLEYEKSTRPYYDSVIRDLAKNMALLQLKNIFSVDMTKDDLEKMPRSELDKILEKIKRDKDRAFEEEYILQQEAKYRKIYIDPNKAKLEKDMKNMLNNFTQKINSALRLPDKK
jgi:hypothetical protein